LEKEAKEEEVSVDCCTLASDREEVFAAEAHGHFAWKASYFWLLQDCL